MREPVLGKRGDAGPTSLLLHVVATIQLCYARLNCKRGEGGLWSAWPHSTGREPIATMSTMAARCRAGRVSSSVPQRVSPTPDGTVLDRFSLVCVRGAGVQNSP